MKIDKSKLAVCDLHHGSTPLTAEVYGHIGRTCIRLAGTGTWVYSPGAADDKWTKVPS